MCLGLAIRLDVVCHTPCYNLEPSITNVLFQVEFQWRVFDNAA